APISKQSLPDGRELIRTAFLRKGLNEKSAEIMADSIASSTLKQYQSTFKLWIDFAKKNNINVLEASVPEVISFLTKRFEEGASYSTLNTTRSAIALISGSDLSSDELLSRFLKGVYRKKPTKPRYSSTWDVSPVLEYLK
ncbi:GSCOCG00005581001-RA-CDS, partial [Cotesia congregata]